MTAGGMTAGELTGTHGQVWPYVRGAYPRDTLYLLWRLMEREAGGEKLFFSQQGGYDVRGDLTEFVRFFSESTRQLFIVQALEEPREVQGFVWLDDITPEHKAAINVFFRRKYWGAAAREAAELVIRYAFEVMKLSAVWAFTPWALAARMAQALAFEPVAVLPDFVRVDGQSHDVHIFRKVRDGG